MTPQEKIRFIFAMYDFDESGVLTIDEMILAIRSTMSGLAKISQVDPPPEVLLEKIAVQAFHHSNDKKKSQVDEDPTSVLIDPFDTDSCIELEGFVSFCQDTPEIVSWIDFFDDLEEFDLEMAITSLKDKELNFEDTIEHLLLDREIHHEEAMNTDEGVMTDTSLWKIETEQRGMLEDLQPRQSWLSTVAFASTQRVPEEEFKVPTQEVHMKWVYGYNAHVSRQSLFYAANHTILYPAASTVVSLDVVQNHQEFFTDHTDLVLCLKMFETEDRNIEVVDLENRTAIGGKEEEEEEDDPTTSGGGFGTSQAWTIVATGQVGIRPSIKVWRLETNTLLASLRGFHKRGVSHVDFSPSGNLLLSVGLDPYHSVAIYDWKRKVKIFSGRNSENKVLDASFLTETTFAVCGVDHIYFWVQEMGKSVFRRYRGFFGRNVNPEPLWSVGCLIDTVVTGSDSGFLRVWEGRNCVKSIKAHTGAITALYILTGADEEGMVTGCTHGKIQVWNAHLDLGATFSVSSMGAIVPGVASLCWDSMSGKLLIGTLGNEIFEMNVQEGRNVHEGAVVSSHFDYGLHGLASHPFKPEEACTVGYDCSVRIWDFSKKRLIRMALLDTMARCCAYSPDGNMIAIGLGNGINGFYQKKEGAFVVLSEDDLTIIHEARDSKNLISDIKFSPDGATLAVASHDASVYLYNVGDFASKAKCRGHTGKVLNVDFSCDSQFLRSHCSVGELLFWDSDNGETQPPKNMREMDWDTNTCTTTWGTQGCWSLLDDKADINSCSLSNSEEVISVVNNHGLLKLYNYPCGVLGANCVTKRGHSAGSSMVRFSLDDSKLMTIGSKDCCLIEWEVYTPESQDWTDFPTIEDEDEYLSHDKRGVEMLHRTDQEEEANNFDKRAVFELEKAEEDDDGADGGNLVKPWQRTIVGPTRPPPDDFSEPKDDLELEFVYGYRSNDTRSAVKYTHERDVIFFIGTVGIVMDHNRAQRFYMEHTDEILHLALHPTLPIAATSQGGRIPKVHIWNYETMKTLQILRGIHRNGISELCFNSDGKLLACVGKDKFQTITIYDWREGMIRTSSTSLKDKTMDLCFTPDDSGLIHVGTNFIRFWTIEGRNMNYQDAFLGRKARVQTFLNIGWCGSSPVIGTSDGHLYKFLGRQLDAIVKAHDQAVFTIHSTSSGLATGGHDGCVKLWTNSLECKMTVNVRSLKAHLPPIRSVCWDVDHGRILIGTLGAEIYEVNGHDGTNAHRGAFLEGHSGEELWGLSPHPSLPQFATVGEDSVLKVWDVFNHNMIGKMKLEMPARAVCYHPQGDRLVVGFGSSKKFSKRQYDGKWIVVHADDFRLLHEARDSQKWLTDIKFSPDGELLAIGSWDAKIYVYAVSSGYGLSTVISQHNSPIRHLDFSQDSVWIQSNCGAFELCFFEADTGMFVPAASRLRDTRWSTQTCTMSWATQGLWPPQLDGTDITSVDCNLFREQEGVVLVGGDCFGRIHLSRYPCPSMSCCTKQYRTHTGPVSKIRWVSGDSHLISTGAKDRGIFQWRHIREEGEEKKQEGVGSDMDDDMSEFVPGILSSLEEVEDWTVPMEETVVASKPWVASLVEPSEPPQIVDDSPYAQLKIDHIHGVQSELSRSSVQYNIYDEIVFPTSNKVVVFNRKANQQRYFSEHNEDVVSVAVSPNLRMVASADRSFAPIIRIWDAVTCLEIIAFKPFHRGGVVSLSFSEDGHYLVSVGYDSDHSIALWESLSGEWFDGYLSAICRGDSQPVTFASFYNHEHLLLASGGRSHFKFWQKTGGTLNCVHPVLPPSFPALPTMLCGAGTVDLFVAGSTNGNIYVFRGDTLDRTIRAHELSVTAIFSSPKVGVVTGGKEGTVKIWTTNLEHISSIHLQEALIPPLNESIRSLHGGLSVDGSTIVKVLVSTAGSEIYEIATQSSSVSLVQEGHFIGEVWGLATHPLDPDIFVTTGDDMTVRVWSIHLRRMLRKAVLDCTTRCVEWSPDGEKIIVGMGGQKDGKKQKKDGAFLILNARTLEPIFEGRDCRHWLRDCKFSPDGKSFAVGCMDNKIYIYSLESFRLKATCDKHNSYIRFFDFSKDGGYIQSDSGDFDHLYFETSDGSFFAAQSQLKNMEWNSWTCLYGWPVQGIWPSYLERTEEGKPDPTSLHRTLDQQLTCVGNEKGGVRVYNCPVVNKTAQYLEESKPTHTGEVGNTRFSIDGKYAISVGKSDRCVVIWRVQRTEEEETKSENLLKDVQRKKAMEGVSFGGTSLVVKKEDEGELETKDNY